jgi:hypothetical protein
VTLTFYTVDGTLAASDTDPGQYPNQVAVALLPSDWQFVADQLAGLATVPLLDWVPTAYPAAVYPMGASVNTGIAQLITNIQASPLGTPKGLAGYSQGAIVTSTVWRDYILNPSGSLHAYLPDFEAGGSVTWGNPMRAPNVCNGNTYAGWAPQSGGGISGSNDLLPSQTPSWWLDFANPNDLYTDSPVSVSADGTSIVLNDTAEDEELIYNLIVTSNYGGTLKGLLALVEQAADQLKEPLSEVIGIATSIYNGLTFVAAGPAAGHYTYDITPAISYLQHVPSTTSIT